MAERKLLGYVAVDSGQLMITDPGYLNTWVDNDYDAGTKGEYSYGGACDATLSDVGGQLNFPLGHAGAGVAFRSGVGDGMYPVIGTIEDLDDWGRRITKVEILMVFDGRHPYELSEPELNEYIEGVK